MSFSGSPGQLFNALTNSNAGAPLDATRAAPAPPPPPPPIAAGAAQQGASTSAAAARGVAAGPGTASIAPTVASGGATPAPEGAKQKLSGET